MTLSEWVKESQTLIGGESPALDARLILKHVTGLTHGQQIVHAHDQLTSEDRKQLHLLRERRLAGEPIAYIIHSKEFYGRSFYVDERVLIPRADTEILVETVLTAVKNNVVSLDLPIIDVATGSGAIGITLAAELGVDVLLSDISSEALAVARINSTRLLGRELECIECDLLPLGQKYGIIVSNPPYLTDAWVEAVDKSVHYEPKRALRGFGADGLAIIKALIAQSKEHRSLFLECDYRQTQDVAVLLEASGFRNVTIERDLANLERVVWGVRE
ncbi:MAG: peptide chain release factor N(5)-glutamine methyltransferase [Sphaerochaeta sp.]